MTRALKESVDKEELYQYFEEKLTVDTITVLTNLSFKTISKYYQIYLRNKKREELQNKKVYIEDAPVKKTKPKDIKKPYSNKHIIRPDSIENCKDIIKLKEDEIKYMNMKFNRISKKIIELEKINDNLMKKNEKLNDELCRSRDKLRIY